MLFLRLREPGKGAVRIYSPAGEKLTVITNSTDCRRWMPSDGYYKPAPRFSKSHRRQSVDSDPFYKRQRFVPS